MTISILIKIMHESLADNNSGSWAVLSLYTKINIMEEEQRLIHEFNNNILEFNGEFRHIKRKAYLFSQ